MRLEIRRQADLGEVEATAWNRLAGDSPFLRHEFLAALEHSGCVGTATAWQPMHLTAWSEAGQLLGALPLYLKHDSFGEFVFDWGWADAYENANLHYYPKLVCAVPFTPASGERLLIHPEADFAQVSAALLNALQELAAELGVSSVHVLFPSSAQRQVFAAAGYLSRKACQFHWHNDAYRDFEDFLARFSSAKRKKARRERRRVAESGIEFEHLRGDEPSAADWDAIYEFYTRTFLRRGRQPYLNRAFFDEVARTMPEQIVIILARFAKQPIATAVCFRSAKALYGRYWGSVADFHSLHFEVCYYQGIEYCIREGLTLFEPGTQGEHKIARGFTPVCTWSSHWISNPDFAQAVAQFLRREEVHIDAYIDELNEHVPYREDTLETGKSS
jgi:predicted N-acyltransferase